MQKLVVSYAQNREDRILEGFFRDVKDGFYVDVGANHPLKHSVTKLFYMQGWHGINLEPNESLAAMLRFDRPKDTVLNIGISDKSGTLAFTEYANHGLSTFSRQMKEEYTHTSSAFTDTFREYEVPVRTLAEVFAEQKVTHIHFMKVDVEGYEYEVLAGNDWKKYRPEMICIESNHIVKDWRPLLKKEKYTKVFNDGLNDYYLSEEAIDRRNNFSYARAMLESGEIANEAVYEKVLLAEQNQALAELRLRETNSQKIRAEFQANWYENAPLSWMIRKTLKAIDRAITNRLHVETVDRAVFDTGAKVVQEDTVTAHGLRKLQQSYAASVRSERIVPSVASRRAKRVANIGFSTSRKVAKATLKPVMQRRGK